MAFMITSSFAATPRKGEGEVIAAGSAQILVSRLGRNNSVADTVLDRLPPHGEASNLPLRDLFISPKGHEAEMQPGMLRLGSVMRVS